MPMQALRRYLVLAWLVFRRNVGSEALIILTRGRLRIPIGSRKVAEPAQGPGRLLGPVVGDGEWGRDRVSRHVLSGRWPQRRRGRR